MSQLILVAGGWYYRFVRVGSSGGFRDALATRNVAILYNFIHRGHTVKIIF